MYVEVFDSWRNAHITPANVYQPKDDLFAVLNTLPMLNATNQLKIICDQEFYDALAAQGDAKAKTDEPNPLGPADTVWEPGHAGFYRGLPIVIQK